ncbi:MAG: M20 family metallopeptidase [Candidatus Humimicrobiaceae bacterium]
MSLTQKIDEWISINKEKILEELSGLIRIKTINNPPGGNEKPGQEYIYNLISKFLSQKDIDIFEIDDVHGIRENKLFFSTINGLEKIYKNRPNLVAKIPGQGSGKSICFSGHMDVMPVKEEKWEVFKDPFSGKVKDGKMFGRGTADMKAGTYAGFVAIKCIKDLDLKLKGNVYAESVVDEEYGGVNGTVAARLRNPDIDFAILSEPTGLVMGIESIGGTDWVVNISQEGRGGIPTAMDIPNPIYKLAKIILVLEKYDKEFLPLLEVPEAYSKDFHPRLLTYQIYSGGDGYNQSGSVPNNGHIFLWLESFAYQDLENYKKTFLNFMKVELTKYYDFKDSFPEFKPVIRYLAGHKTERNHPAMSKIREAYKLSGIKCEEGGVPFAMDAFAFKETSTTDVVVIGPRGGNLHGIDEYMEIDSFFKLIKLMVLSAANYCI